MRPRLVAVATGLALLMSLFGYGVYAALGHFRKVGNSAATAAPVKPVDVKPALALPGTLYLAQQGDLYALNGTTFRQVLTHDDTHGSWTQPAVLAGGMLVVVGRQGASSGLWQVSPDGSIAGQLIGGAASTLSDGTLVDNHWFFHPRLGPDGKTLWFSYDSPKNGYLIDLAVWAMPVPAPEAAPTPTPGRGLVRPVLPRTATRWSDPNQYTGGDIEPIPLASGGVLFTRYSFDNADHVHSQIWWAPTALAGGTALTDVAQDCAQPAPSPDGAEIAMVCTNGDQVARLVVAPFSTGTATGPTPTPTGAARGTRPPTAPAPQIGAQRVVVDGTLVAQPVWAPDGTGLAYLAPSETGANFQLWWIPGTAAALTAPPQQVTRTVGFDATSRPLWLAS